MDKSLLVKLFGFPATLVHGSPTVLDRWRWLRRHLPRTRNGERILEVGCGTGAFSIGAALRGYSVVGLSWDERNQSVAAERAAICRASNAHFQVGDARHLGDREDFKGGFDIVIACEVIEHVLDDRKLMSDMAACLKPGGRLLLTAPNLDYIGISDNHIGPFADVEDGGHVRKGYSAPMLLELCRVAGLDAGAISSCSGLVSQKLTGVKNGLEGVHPMASWLFTLPLRPLPVLSDRLATRMLAWPDYSICLDAYKPRFA